MQPFSAQAETLEISVTSTASASQALSSVGGVIRLVNEGTSICFVSVGTGAQTATLPGTSAGTAVATSTPVLPGTDVVFSLPDPQPSSGTAPTPLNISAICRAAASTTLLASVSYGQ